MANATILPVSGTQRSNFMTTVTLDVAIQSLGGLYDADTMTGNIQLTDHTENGADGVTVTVAGSGMNWTITFALPMAREGSFEIGVIGMVTQAGAGSMPEGVMSNRVTIYYDTTTDVTASWGTVEYLGDGVVAVPITFSENVVIPSKTVFLVSRVSGDTLEGVDYQIVGEDTEFKLIFQIPPDRSGSFRVSADGDVFKVSSGVWDNVVIPPITVDYGTLIPRIVDYDIPEDYTHGEKFDVRIAYNVQVTGLSDNNVHQVFILEGAADMMGTPTPYKWIGDSPPDFEMPVPEDLTGTDWQQLVSPPAGVPTTPENDFDENGFWHGAANEGQYFLIRWIVQEGTTGIFSMTPRDGMVRGPVS